MIPLALRVLTAIMLLGIAVSYAQSPSDDDDDIQSWNDLQITIPISEHFELMTVTTAQFDSNISRLANTRFAVGVTAKPNNRFSLTPFMTFISSRSSNGDFRYEYRTSLRAVYRMPVKRFTVSHRSQIEYRIRPGKNTVRYRPSITVEHPLPKKFLSRAKVFVTEEPFFDSASGRFSRNRLSFGINRAINSRLSVDLFYLYQGDNFSKTSVNVLGTAWKLKF